MCHHQRHLVFVELRKIYNIVDKPQQLCAIEAYGVQILFLPGSCEGFSQQLRKTKDGIHGRAHFMRDVLYEGILHLILFFTVFFGCYQRLLHSLTIGNVDAHTYLATIRNFYVGPAHFDVAAIFGVHDEVAKPGLQ